MSARTINITNATALVWFCVDDPDWCKMRTFVLRFPHCMLNVITEGAMIRLLRWRMKNYESLLSVCFVLCQRERFS